MIFYYMKMLEVTNGKRNKKIASEYSLILIDFWYPSSMYQAYP